MADTKTTTSSGGIGFCGLLTIAFIVLKLTHYIDWSWWWVASPIWLPIVAVIAFLLACIVGIFAWHMVLLPIIRWVGRRMRV